MKIVSVIGARPNYMKMAPLHWALQAHAGVTHTILHSGQHYSNNLSAVSFISLFDLPPAIQCFPDPELNTVARWAVMQNLIREQLRTLQPDWVLVYGDVDTTILATLAAKSLGLCVAHVESGLRSFDSTMPEERNRFAVDHLADLLFVTEQSGLQNLDNEGVVSKKVHFVGNTMIDTLYVLQPKILNHLADQIPFDYKQIPFSLATFHRSDLSVRHHMKIWLESILNEELKRNAVVWPVHPRIRFYLETEGFWDRLYNREGLFLLDALEYLDFQSLLCHAKRVLTDSGGVQEECCFWKKPCFTFRTSTERPATVACGWNKMSDSYKDLDSTHIGSGMPPLWDGFAAVRIAEILIAN